MATPTAATMTWQSSSPQSMPGVFVLMPMACASAVPMNAAIIPTTIVSQIGMLCRPGTTRRPSAPTMRPMMIAVTIPVTVTAFPPTNLGFAVAGVMPAMSTDQTRRLAPDPQITQSGIHGPERHGRRVVQICPGQGGRLGRVEGDFAGLDRGQPETVENRQLLVLEQVATHVHPDKVGQADLDAELLAGLAHGGVPRVLEAVAEAAGQVPRARVGLPGPQDGQVAVAVDDDHAAGRPRIDEELIATGRAAGRRPAGQPRGAP